MDAYREAQRLYAEAMLSTAAGADRIARLEQALQQMGALVPHAGPSDKVAVLLMSSSIAELIAREAR